MNKSIKSLTQDNINLIKEYLKNNDFVHNSNKSNELFKKDSVNITVYKNGTVLFQGKNGIEWFEEINCLLNKDIINKQDISNAIEDFPLPKIGSDESGKGDFFGPLVVSAVLIKDNKQLNFIKSLGVTDSKKISDNRIKEIAIKLEKQLIYDTVLISPAKYNDLYSKMNNLNLILAWAHSTAINNIADKNDVELVIIDKFCNKSILENIFDNKVKKLNLTQVTNAERDLAVAAASIIARFAFIKWLMLYEKEKGIMLPKGANNEVIKVGKKIYNDNGKDGLNEVAKLHFKTYNKIVKDV